LNGIPLNTANAFVSYQFPNGFGIRANASFTSSWRASRTAVVPSEYTLNGGVFYATKQWRFALDLSNITNATNWSHGAGVAGDTTGYLLQALPFGVSGKISYKF
jgi:outer membrane receptor protein involved in Fe transport